MDRAARRRIGHVRFVLDGRQEGAIAADVIVAAGVPHLCDLVGPEQVGQQLDVIAMRVTQDHMVDGGERGAMARR
jgi:hypothetical protein